MIRLSASYYIGIILLVQALVTGILTQSLQFHDMHNTTVAIANTIAFINSCLVFIALRPLLSDDFKTEIIQKQHHYLKCIESLLKSARSQRHDFINHLQAIYGLVQLNRFPEAKEYLQTLWKETRDISGIIQLKFPEVSALIYRKINQAAAQQIVVDLDIQTDLAESIMKPYFINVVLGNLLDNAFEAVLALDPKDRFVSIGITESTPEYQIYISNTGPSPGEEAINKMFDPGYSTKGTNRGLGLSSVAETLRKYGGAISFSSDPITFLVTIPKKEG